MINAPWPPLVLEGEPDYSCFRWLLGSPIDLIVDVFATIFIESLFFMTFLQ